jgi:hypothetical protein
MIKTVDNKGIERTLSLQIYNSLPINKDGSRGQSGLRPVNPVTDKDEVSNELADFIASKKKIVVSKLVEEVPSGLVALNKDTDYNLSALKVDEVTGEPIEKKVVVVKKTRAKRGAKKSK